MLSKIAIVTLLFASVKAARMFDGKSDKLRTDVAILVEGDTIKEIGAPAQITAKAPGARVIDLGNATLLPGSSTRTRTCSPTAATTTPRCSRSRA